MKSRALVQVDDRRLEVREFDVPDRPPPGGALLAVEGCGMCGSDFDFYDGAARRNGYGTYPMVLGHEPVGRIASITAEARQRWGVGEGDRVAIEPYVPCGVCPSCLAGQHRYCRQRFVYASAPLTDAPGLWGGYAQVMALRTNTVVHRVPDALSVEDAVLFNPIGAAVEWALRAGGLQLGDTLAVLGTGQRGLAAIAVARSAGAGHIVAAARTAGRNADLAAAFGADAVVAVGDCADDGLESLKSRIGPRGADVVLDLVPHRVQTLQVAIELARPGGTVVMAGIKGERAAADFIVDRAVLKGLRLQGVLGVSSWAYARAIDIVASRRFPLERMHTHTVGLDGAEAMMRAIGREIPGVRPLHVTVRP
ncbi:MAG: zinc-binding dehydrogenase [Gammaproteobacteria bacterium]